MPFTSVVPAESVVITTVNGAEPLVTSATQSVPLVVYSYPLIVAPPSLAGALNDTVALALPWVTARFCGAPGVVRGVTSTA